MWAVLKSQEQKQSDPLPAKRGEIFSDENRKRQRPAGGIGKVVWLHQMGAGSGGRVSEEPALRTRDKWGQVLHFDI